jgi:hypothetical protein
MQNLLYSFALGINYDANNVPQIYFENFLNSILIKRSGSVLQWKSGLIWSTALNTQPAMGKRLKVLNFATLIIHKI